MDSKVHQQDFPPETIVELVRAVLKSKASSKSFGTFSIEIQFRDGWPTDVAVVEKTTHKFERPK